MNRFCDSILVFPLSDFNNPSSVQLSVSMIFREFVLFHLLCFFRVSATLLVPFCFCKVIALMFGCVSEVRPLGIAFFSSFSDTCFCQFRFDVLLFVTPSHFTASVRPDSTPYGDGCGGESPKVLSVDYVDCGKSEYQRGVSVKPGAFAKEAFLLKQETHIAESF